MFCVSLALQNVLTTVRIYVFEQTIGFPLHGGEENVSIWKVDITLESLV